MNVNPMQLIQMIKGGKNPQQLSTDITEMIKDASPEERATLHQKMTTLASKIA